MDKIKLEDLTERNFEDARGIVRYVVAMQTAPVESAMILPILAKIRGLHAGLNAGLHAGLYDGLSAGLNAGLSDSLNAGLNAGLYAGLDDGLNDGLNDGLRDGLNAGLHAGLYDGLNAGLSAGLNAGLSDGLDAGLSDGLDAGLSAGLSNIKNLKVEYCGVWWSWWLCRYLIASKWGCPLDKDKLALLWGFCMHTPIALREDKKIFVAKPTKIKWNILGKTKAPFKFPIYELHADGESAVECLGLKLYYNHNLKLPEHIGKTKIADWKPEWVLEETNAELRRCLLQNIPSDKLLGVLKCKTIDTWDSGKSVYELVEIENNPYPSRYRALRFTCPTTGKPYLERTHPDETSARNANLVANHGIDAKSFGWEC